MSPNNANGDVRRPGGHEPLRVMSPKMLTIQRRPLGSPVRSVGGLGRPPGGSDGDRRAAGGRSWRDPFVSRRGHGGRRAPPAGIELRRKRTVGGTVSTTVRHAGRDRIGQVTDVSEGEGWHDQPVVITIRLDALDPPAGRVSLPDGRELGFVGWLGLLQVLAQLVEAAPG